MAELVGDHVVDGVDRRLHEAAVQEQACEPAWKSDPVAG